MYYRARYYHTDLGKFVGRDPIEYEAGDPNLYRYVANAPVGLTDPSGGKSLCCVPDHIEFAGVGEKQFPPGFNAAGLPITGRYYGIDVRLVTQWKENDAAQQPQDCTLQFFEYVSLPITTIGGGTLAKNMWYDMWKQFPNSPTWTFGIAAGEQPWKGHKVPAKAGQETYIIHDTPAIGTPGALSIFWEIVLTGGDGKTRNDKSAHLVLNFSKGTGKLITGGATPTKFDEEKLPKHVVTTTGKTGGLPKGLPLPSDD